MTKSTDRLRDYLTQNKVKANSLVDKRLLDDELKSLRRIKDTICYINSYTEGRILYHSGFDTILGYPRSTEVDQNFILDIIHPDDKPIAHYLIHAASVLHLEYHTDITPFETGFEINYRVRKHDGNYIMMLKRSTGFMNKDIRSGANLSVLQDINFLELGKRIRSKVIGTPEMGERYEKYLLEVQARSLVNETFTRRETEVLLLVARGIPSKEIAETLFISKHTVDNHRKNMLRKSGCASSTELLHFSLNEGLL